VNEQTTRFERRIEALVAAYADRAPTAVDAAAMTRSAASARTLPAPWRRELVPARPLALLGIAAAVAVVLMGLLLLGAGSRAPLVEATSSPLPSAPSSSPSATQRIGYLGLPPVGASPSTPEIGELVLSFGARSKQRIPCCGMLGAWLFADGRLIRALEGDPAMDALFEQRLTPAGVALVLDAGLAALPDAEGGTFVNGGYWFFWGGYSVRSGNRMVSVGLTNADGAPSGLQLTHDQEHVIWELDARLRSPEAWLPANAWLDSTPRPFVASRYDACVVDEVKDKPSLDRLPAAAAALLRERGVARPDEFGTCYAITTGDARSLVVVLEAAGYADDPGFGWPSTLTYRPAPGIAATEGVFIDPILPNDAACCRGG